MPTYTKMRLLLMMGELSEEAYLKNIAPPWKEENSWNNSIQRQAGIQHSAYF
jgi:hypothetical protein